MAIKIGVRNLEFADLSLPEDKRFFQPLARCSNAEYSLEFEEEVFYVDYGGSYEIINQLKHANVSLTVSRVDWDKYVNSLNYEGSKFGFVVKKDYRPKYIAIRWMNTLTDGTFEGVTFSKGILRLDSESSETISNSFTWQPVQLTGTFIFDDNDEIMNKYETIGLEVIKDKLILVQRNGDITWEVSVDDNGHLITTQVDDDFNIPTLFTFSGKRCEVYCNENGEPHLQTVESERRFVKEAKIYLTSPNGTIYHVFATNDFQLSTAEVDSIPHYTI